MQWSHSSLRQYEECPLALYLRKVERVPQVVPQYVKDGSTNHRWLELFSRRMADTADSPTEIGSELLVDAQAKGISEQFVSDVVDVASYMPTPGPGQAAVTEEPFALDRNMEETSYPDAYWRGRVDYMLVGADQLTVLDWKTGWAYLKPTDLVQVLRYAGSWLAANPRLQRSITRIRCMVIAPRRQSVLDEVYTVEAALGALSHAYELAAKGDVVLGTGERPAPELGAHCARCFVRHACPAYETYIQPDEPDDAADAWGRLAALEDAVRGMKAHVQLLIETEGPFEAEGGLVDFHDQIAVSLDPRGVLGTLKEHGLGADVFLNAVSCSRTRLLRALPRDRKELGETIIEHHGTVSHRRVLKLGPLPVRNASSAES